MSFEKAASQLETKHRNTWKQFFSNSNNCISFLSPVLNKFDTSTVNTSYE